jgi:hypothetical protein
MPLPPPVLLAWDHWSLTALPRASISHGSGGLKDRDNLIVNSREVEDILVRGTDSPAAAW